MNWFPWAALSALFAGVPAVLGKAGLTGLNSPFATTVHPTIALLFTSGFAAIFAPPWNLLDIPRRPWILLALSGGATALSWLCYVRALQLVEAFRVAPADKLSAVFAVLLAALLLKEKLRWQHGIRGARIVNGAILVALKPS
jgi:transporter family protein